MTTYGWFFNIWIIMPDINPEIQKEAVKEALKEWLNEQFATFGKFSLTALISTAFIGVVYLWLAGHGWTK